MNCLIDNEFEVNSINTTDSVQLSDNHIQEYQDILNFLADENVLAYGCVLKETIRLTEDLVGRRITNEVVINFVSQAAIHLSKRQWVHYGNSTARLELHLRAMSSVLHIFSQLIANESGPMIDAKVRETLYKSVSKFWATYRTSKIINANITFALREIRTCLRKIKDDRNIALGVTVNIFDVISNVITKEYWAAAGSFIKALDFEYPAGEWYYDWQEIRVEFFKLRQQLSEIDDSAKSKTVTQFYNHLYKLSTEEFETVRRKNTVIRNFEYKMLKSGGSIAGCSLPDHIDTLLIGYLDLIQRMLTEFPQMSIHTLEIIGFCNEIYDSHVKKQLTCKAVEVLYVINKISKKKLVRNMIKVTFKSLQQATPPDSPTSANFSNSSQERIKRKNLIRRARNAIIVNSNLSEIPNRIMTNFQKIRQKQVSSLRNRIVDNVEKLMKEKTKVGKNVQEIREIKEKQDNKLSEDKSDQEPFLLKVKRFLGKRDEEKKTRLNNLQETSRVGRSNSDQNQEKQDNKLSDNKSDKEPFLLKFKRSLRKRNEEKKKSSNNLQETSRDGRNNSDQNPLYKDKAENKNNNISAGEIGEVSDSDLTIENEFTHQNDLDNVTSSNITNEENEHNDNILLQEEVKENPNEMEVVDADHEYTLEEVEEILKHQNDLDNEITFTSSDVINEENEPDEVIKQINNYSQCDEENRHITIDEDVECFYMQHMDSVELEEILNHQKYLEDEHITDNAFVNEDVHDLNISTKTPKTNENTFVEEFEGLYLDNFEFPIIEQPKILTHEVEINNTCSYQPPPYEELSSSKSALVNFYEFRKFLLTQHEVDSSNPLWNVDNVNDFEEMYSKTFKDFDKKVQYINFINDVQYNQIKQINQSYEKAPSYEELSSSKSELVNFEEFKKFLLNQHQVDPSHPLWKVDNVQEFEEIYSKTFNNSKPQDRYVNFVNNVQQNIVINIERQDPNEIESAFFNLCKKVFVNIVENITEGTKAAKKKSLNEKS
ncbi:16881_t:CDS:2 [Funneliformis mosseae]|uniref:16881_t:CDS:1 n=1 Tax=Funneliformis mosseae TaxID=27381 RepID=A0A9N9BL89_FUNMO|nr:16881_t:CDS:2 [Funneliformis mosseae]